MSLLLLCLSQVSRLHLLTLLLLTQLNFLPMFINSLNSIERGFGLAQIDNRKFIAPLVAAAVPAIISAVGAVAGSALNKKSIDSNNALQQKLVQDANAYNTPANQMQRFQDAGLNPYMMLGQVNAGNQTSVASTSPVDYSSGVQGVGNAVNTLIQAASAGSQIEVNKATIAKTESETALNQIDAQTRAAENVARLNQLVKQGVLTQQQADNLSQQFDLTQITWDELIKQPGLANSLTTEQLESLKAGIAKIESEKKGIDLQNGITSKFGEKQAAATLGNTLSQTGVNHANIGLMGSQIGLNGTYMDLNRGQLGVVRNQQNSEFWKSKENKRIFQYNSKKHDRPNVDWWTENYGTPVFNLLGHIISAAAAK
nr:MAG TPA: DNA pilot protein VP2 [Microviridae sp.]